MDLDPKYEFSDRKCPQTDFPWLGNINIMILEVSTYQFKRSVVFQMYLLQEILEISLKSLILPPDLSPKYPFSDQKFPQIVFLWLENISTITVKVSMHHIKRFMVLQMYLFVEIFEISLKSLILPPGFKPKI
jgi:hypothetical protein